MRITALTVAVNVPFQKDKLLGIATEILAGVAHVQNSFNTGREKSNKRLLQIVIVRDDIESGDNDGQTTKAKQVSRYLVDK